MREQDNKPITPANPKGWRPLQSDSLTPRLEPKLQRQPLKDKPFVGLLRWYEKRVEDDHYTHSKIRQAADLLSQTPQVSSASLALVKEMVIEQGAHGRGPFDVFTYRAIVEALNEIEPWIRIMEEAEPQTDTTVRVEHTHRHRIDIPKIPKPKFPKPRISRRGLFWTAALAIPAVPLALIPVALTVQNFQESQEKKHKEAEKLNRYKNATPLSEDDKLQTRQLYSIDKAPKSPDDMEYRIKANPYGSEGADIKAENLPFFDIRSLFYKYYSYWNQSHPTDMVSHSGIQFDSYTGPLGDKIHVVNLATKENGIVSKKLPLEPGIRLDIKISDFYQESSEGKLQPPVKDVAKQGELPESVLLRVKTPNGDVRYIQFVDTKRPIQRYIFNAVELVKKPLPLPPLREIPTLPRSSG